MMSEKERTCSEQIACPFFLNRTGHNNSNDQGHLGIRLGDWREDISVWWGEHAPRVMRLSPQPLTETHQIVMTLGDPSRPTRIQAMYRRLAER